MASLNKVMLIGNLGKDPELTYTPSGTAVCKITIATSEKYKDKAGEQIEKTEWHNVIMWNKLAEIAGQYLEKGKPVYLEGKITTRRWEDKEGNTRYTTEIVADKMVMLGSRGESTAAGHDHQESGPAYQDDDIPF